MSTIQDLDKLQKYLTEDDIIKLDSAAGRHKTQSNINFKIQKIGVDFIEILTNQDQTSSGRYASQATLVKRTEDLFRKFLPAYKLNVSTETHFPAPANVVDTKWIENMMETKGVRIKQIAFDTGIDRQSISDWVTGKRAMGQIVKAMFYFYLTK